MEKCPFKFVFVCKLLLHRITIVRHSIIVPTLTVWTCTLYTREVNQAFHLNTNRAPPVQPLWQRVREIGGLSHAWRKIQFPKKMLWFKNEIWLVVCQAMRLPSIHYSIPRNRNMLKSLQDISGPCKAILKYRPQAVWWGVSGVRCWGKDHLVIIWSIITWSIWTLSSI